MATNLSTALLGLRATGLTLTDIAQATGIAQSSLSRLIAENRRPDVDTLRALCVKSPCDEAGKLDLLLAHLRDEVDRAGRLQTDVRISRGERPTDDLAILADELQDEYARGSSELRDLLHGLAGLCLAHRQRYDPYEQKHPLNQKAAEEISSVSPVDEVIANEDARREIEQLSQKPATPPASKARSGQGKEAKQRG